MSKHLFLMYLAIGGLIVAWVNFAPRLIQRPPSAHAPSLAEFPSKFRDSIPPAAPAAPDPRPVPGFSLTDQRGQPVTRESLLGKVWVADFIFSSCPGACLEMTKHMGSIKSALPAGDDVRAVTFSIDPKNDTPSKLAAYAERNGASPRWIFLTGDRAVTARVANEGFLFPLSSDPASFEHSERIAVVDKTGTVRGWFDSGASDLVPSVTALVAKLRLENPGASVAAP